MCRKIMLLAIFSLLLFHTIFSPLLSSPLSIRIPLFQFYMAIFFMYVLGYPLGHTALLGAVSKVYGNRPQGFIMVQ